MFWGWLACRQGEPPATQEDPRPQGPFVGSRLVAVDGGVWVGSPGGGEAGAPGEWAWHPGGGAVARTLTEGAPGDLGGGLAVCPGGALVVGAPGRGDGGAWVVTAPGDVTVGAEAFVEGTYDAGRAGVTVACGDAGGDGAFDFAVGAPAADVDRPAAGTVGTWSWVDEVPDRTASFDTSFGGSALGDAGGLLLVDVTGDGVDDLLVAGAGADRVHLVPGPLDGSYAASSSVTWQGDDGDRAGAAIAVGDLTGDGVPDLVLGAPEAASGRGGLWVVAGPLADGGGLLRALPEATFVPGVGVGAGLGAALAVVGDVDGDGADDVLVGSPTSPGAGPDAGAAYLVLASQVGAIATIDEAAAILLPAASGGTFGAAVAGGDLDGDGVPELIVGAPLAKVGGDLGVGRVLVFDGAARGVVYDDDADEVR
jgi:hypothetical protein